MRILTADFDINTARQCASALQQYVSKTSSDHVDRRDGYDVFRRVLDGYQRQVAGAVEEGKRGEKDPGRTIQALSAFPVSIANLVGMQGRVYEEVYT